MYKIFKFIVFSIVCLANKTYSQKINYDEYKSCTPGFTYTNQYENNSNKLNLRGDLDFSIPIWADGQQALAKKYLITVNKWYKNIPNTTIEVKNMPPIADQGGFPYCYTYSWSTLLKQYKAQQYNFPSFSCYPSTVDISELALTQIMHTIEKGGFYFNYEKPIESDDKNMFQSMLVNSDNYVSKSSKPFDNLGKFYDYSENNLLDFSNYLHKIHEKYNNTNISATDLNEISTIIANRMNWPIEILDIKNALKQKDFDKFIYQLLFNNAIYIKNDLATQNATIKYAPTNAYFDLGFTQSLWFIKSKIKEVLQSGSPVQITIDFVVSHILFHPVIICGYKQVEYNGSIKECYKIQNSWGESWQIYNTADGWVDAENLLHYIRKYIDEEKKIYFIRENSLQWFGDEQDFMIKNKDKIIYR